MRYGTSVGLVIAAGVLWSLQGLVFRQIEEAEILGLSCSGVHWAWRPCFWPS